MSVPRLLACVVLLSSCGGDGNPAAPGGGSTFPSTGAQLSYALDLPAGAGPFPAFVMGHGSGRVTKDDVRNLSGRLVAEGYAVLRSSAGWATPPAPTPMWGSATARA